MGHVYANEATKSRKTTYLNVSSFTEYVRFGNNSASIFKHEYVYSINIIIMICSILVPLEYGGMDLIMSSNKKIVY